MENEVVQLHCQVCMQPVEDFRKRFCSEKCNLRYLRSKKQYARVCKNCGKNPFVKVGRPKKEV